MPVHQRRTRWINRILPIDSKLIQALQPGDYISYWQPLLEQLPRGQRILQLDAEGEWGADVVARVLCVRPPTSEHRGMHVAKVQVFVLAPVSLMPRCPGAANTIDWTIVSSPEWLLDRRSRLSRDQRRDRDEFRRLSEGDAENFLGFSDLRSTCLQSSDLARGFRKLHSRPLKAAIRQGVTLLIKYQDRLCWAEVIKTHLFPRRQSGLETEAYRVNLFVNLAGSSSSDSNGLRTIEAVPYSEYALRSGELRPQDMLQDLGDNIDLVPVTILAHAVRGVLNGAVGHLYKTPAGFSGSRQYSRWDQVVYRRRNSHYCTAWVLDHEPRSAKVRLWPVKGNGDLLETDDKGINFIRESETRHRDDLCVVREARQGFSELRAGDKVWVIALGHDERYRITGGNVAPSSQERAFGFRNWLKRGFQQQYHPLAPSRNIKYTIRLETVWQGRPSFKLYARRNIFTSAEDAQNRLHYALSDRFDCDGYARSFLSHRRGNGSRASRSREPTQNLPQIVPWDRPASSQNTGGSEVCRERPQSESNASQPASKAKRNSVPVRNNRFSAPPGTSKTSLQTQPVQPPAVTVTLMPDGRHVTLRRLDPVEAEAERQKLREVRRKRQSLSTSRIASEDLLAHQKAQKVKRTAAEKARLAQQNLPGNVKHPSVSPQVGPSTQAATQVKRGSTSPDNPATTESVLSGREQRRMERKLNPAASKAYWALEQDNRPDQARAYLLNQTREKGSSSSQPNDTNEELSALTEAMRNSEQRLREHQAAAKDTIGKQRQVTQPSAGPSQLQGSQHTQPAAEKKIKATTSGSQRTEAFAVRLVEADDGALPLHDCLPSVESKWDEFFEAYSNLPFKQQLKHFQGYTAGQRRHIFAQLSSKDSVYLAGVIDWDPRLQCFACFTQKARDKCEHEPQEGDWEDRLLAKLEADSDSESESDEEEELTEDEESRTRARIRQGKQPAKAPFQAGPGSVDPAHWDANYVCWHHYSQQYDTCDCTVTQERQGAIDAQRRQKAGKGRR